MSIIHLPPLSRALQEAVWVSDLHPDLKRMVLRYLEGDYLVAHGIIDYALESGICQEQGEPIAFLHYLLGLPAENARLRITILKSLIHPKQDS